MQRFKCPESPVGPVAVPGSVPPTPPVARLPHSGGGVHGFSGSCLRRESARWNQEQAEIVSPLSPSLHSRDPGPGPYEAPHSRAVHAPAWQTLSCKSSCSFYGHFLVSEPHPCAHGMGGGCPSPVPAVSWGPVWLTIGSRCSQKMWSPRRQGGPWNHTLLVQPGLGRGTRGAAGGAGLLEPGALASPGSSPSAASPIWFVVQLLFSARVGHRVLVLPTWKEGFSQMRCALQCACSLKSALIDERKKNSATLRRSFVSRQNSRPLPTVPWGLNRVPWRDTYIPSPVTVDVTLSGSKVVAQVVRCLGRRCWRRVVLTQHGRDPHEETAAPCEDGAHRENRGPAAAARVTATSRGRERGGRGVPGGQRALARTPAPTPPENTSAVWAPRLHRFVTSALGGR